MVQATQYALPIQSFVGAVPKEGPMVVPFNVDFSLAATQTIDLTAQQFQARMSMIQTLFVDNSTSNFPLTIVMTNTNQRVVIPPNSQAYVPIALTTGKIAWSMTSASGQILQFQALNVAMNATVWGVNGTGNYTSGGALIVSDAALDAAIVSGMVQVREFATYGDGSVQPVFKGSKAIAGTFNTGTTATLITGAPGWCLTAIDVTLDGNSTLAAAADLVCTLAETGGATIRTGSAFVPITAVTGLTGGITLMSMTGEAITSKVANSTLTLTLSAALNAGNCRYSARFAQTSFVGG